MKRCQGFRLKTRRRSGYDGSGLAKAINEDDPAGGSVRFAHMTAVVDADGCRGAREVACERAVRVDKTDLMSVGQFVPSSRQ